MYWWMLMAPLARYHLVTKPHTGGTPIMDSEATANAPKVNGSLRPSPSMSGIFLRCVAT